jgi:WD40 repeat protein
MAQPADSSSPERIDAWRRRSPQDQLTLSRALAERALAARAPAVNRLVSGALVALVAAALGCRATETTAPPSASSEPTRDALPKLPARPLASCAQAAPAEGRIAVADQLARFMSATAIAVSDDGTTAIATGGGGSAVWDVRSSRRVDFDASVAGTHVVHLRGSHDAVAVDTGGVLWRWSGGRWSASADLWKLGVTGQILALQSIDASRVVIVSEHGVHRLDLGAPTALDSTSVGPLVAAAASGDHLALASERGDIEVRDETGARVGLLRADEPARRLAVSRDGAYVAWSSLDMKIHMQRIADPSAKAVSFAARRRELIQALDFSEDGSRLLVSSVGGGLTVHDARSGDALRVFPSRPSALAIEYAAASPVSTSTASGLTLTLDQGAVRIHDAASLDPLFMLATRTPFAGDLHLSQDGRWLLQGGGSAYVAWDLARLVPLPLLGAANALGDGAVSRVYFDGESHVVVVTDRRLARVELASGIVEHTTDLPPVFGVVDLAYAPDAKVVLRVDASGALNVDTLDDKSSTRTRPVSAGVASVAMSMAGDRAFLLGKDGRLLLIPVQAPANAKVLGEGLSPSAKIQLSPDGRAVVHEHRRWDVETGAELAVSARFDGDADPMRAGFRAPSVSATSSDGGWHVVGDDTGCVRVLDPATGQVRFDGRVFPAGTGVTSVAASATTGLVFASAADGRVRAWNTARGESLTLASTPGAWAAWRDDGYFASSRLGHELFAMLNDGAAIDPLRVASTYNRPGALLRLLAPAGERRDTDGFAEVLEQSATRRMGGTAAPSALSAPRIAARVIGVDEAGATVSVEVTPGSSGTGAPPRGGPAEDAMLRVRVDGVRRAELDSSARTQRGGTSLRVPLPAGNHLIEVSLAIAGIEAGPPALVSVRSPAPPHAGRLRFFGVGASTYADRRIRPLRFADDDAADLAAALRRSGHAFAEFEATVVEDGATKAQIEAALASWTASARPDDTLIVFFAGHGKQVSGSHALLTFDSDLDALASTTLSIHRVHELLAASAALRRILWIDTCESGDGQATSRQALAEAMQRRGLDPTSARGLDFDAGVAPAGDGSGASTSSDAADRVATWLADRDHLVFAEPGSDSGTITFVSSRGWEPSLEFGALEHGAFTAAILSALSSPQADIDEDGAASVDELVFGAALGVANLTRDLQHPTLLASNPRAPVRLPIVGSDAEASRSDRAPRADEPTPSDAVVREVIRLWYETSSEHAKTHHMEPITIRIAMREETVIAHVHYRHWLRSSAPEAVNSAAYGTDKRWFALALDAQGQWRVTAMGGFMSGLL